MASNIETIISELDDKHKKAYQKDNGKKEIASEASSAIWDMLNDLVGKMSPSEYQNYTMPFMFYSFASFSVGKLMRETLANEDPIDLGNGKTRPLTYADAWNMKDEDGEYTYRDYLIEKQLNKFGYVIEPQYMAERIILTSCPQYRYGVKTDYFIDADMVPFIDYFEDVINTFENRCADNFKGTLNMVNLYNEALGEEDLANNTLSIMFFKIAMICDSIWKTHMCKGDVEGYSSYNADLLGDVYEQLLGYYASNAGKKGGEYYTPAEMSELVAKLATFEVENAASISDPTCGSGSLLIKAARQLKEKDGNVGTLYGQELNSLTARLAKMNMCLHGISVDDFNIANVNTLSMNDNSAGRKFDVTVANPPYALKWDNGEYRLADSRFSGYGALAPASNADLAFVQHIIHHMSDNGHAAILLPLGVLFRGNAEQTIRQAMIDTYNIIDAIVVLPSNCFYGASIPVCCMVLRKDRGTKNDICFIDASNEFVKEGKKNKLTPEGIDKIYNAFAARENIEHFCSIIQRETIRENNYNLNISLYVEAEKIVEEHDIELLAKEYASLEEKAEYLKQSLNTQLPLFGIAPLFSVNLELANKHTPVITEVASLDSLEKEEPLDF